MLLETTSNNPHGEIAASEVEVFDDQRPSEFKDAAALKLVVQDAARAEQWIEQKQWTLAWRETDILYQSPRSLSAWESTGVTRANVSRFTVAKHVNSLVPTVMNGIFYDSPPFVLRPRPASTQASTRAKTALLAALLEEMDFRNECEMGIESQCLNGTGIWTYGFTVTRSIEKIPVRAAAPQEIDGPFGKMVVHTKESDEVGIKEVERTKWRPFFEYCPLGTVKAAPGWRHPNQIWKAPYIVHTLYLNFYDIDKLRNQEGYNIPATEDLKKIFFANAEVAKPPSSIDQQQSAVSMVHHAERIDEKDSEDPLLRVLRVDARWDKYTVKVAIQDKLLIRNETHKFLRAPFLSANWWNIQRAGYGLGVGKLIGSDQRIEVGTTNAALDIVAHAVNPQVLRSRGANVPTQQIRQRLMGIIDVDGDVEKAFKIMDQPEVPQAVWAVIQNAKQSSESTSGADEVTAQGNMPQRGSSVARTATGAGNLAAAHAARIEGPVGRFVNNVFIPFLYALDEMIFEYMPASEIREILGEELGDEMAVKVDMYDLFSSKHKFEVLAGAHLAAKKAMAQALPLMIQIFENPHLLQSLNSMGWTVDTNELFNMMCEMSEWKNARQIIRKMSPQEMQMYGAMQGANKDAQRTEGKIKEIQAKHVATSAEIDQTAEARLATKLTESALDKGEAYIERQAIEHAEAPHGLAPTAEPAFYSSR